MTATELQNYINPVVSLITAIVPLLWVVFAFVVLLIFRSDIRNLAKRLRKGRVLGQEVELDDELRQLHTITTAAREEVEAAPSIAIPETTQASKKVSSDLLDGVLKEAIKSPLTALIILGRELDKQIRRALAATGHLGGREHVPIRQGIRELGRFGLPTSLLGSVELFQNVRNSLVHGRGSPSDDELLSAIDSGLTIITALQALPIQKVVVLEPGVPIYSDADCLHQRSGVWGVLLESTALPEGKKHIQIYPTTRHHFKKGMMVAWEWNMNLVTADSWYKDIETGRPVLAWNSAAEFVGRNLDEI